MEIKAELKELLERYKEDCWDFIRLEALSLYSETKNKRLKLALLQLLMHIEQGQPF